VSAGPKFDVDGDEAGGTENKLLVELLVPPPGKEAPDKQARR